MNLDETLPAFAHCPTCGLLVHVRTWHHGEGWRELPKARSCSTGEVHVCVSPVIVEEN